MTWREVQISGILDRERKRGSLPSHQKPLKQVKTMADADRDISNPFSSIAALKSADDSYLQAVANRGKRFG